MKRELYKMAYIVAFVLSISFVPNFVLADEVEQEDLTINGQFETLSRQSTLIKEKGKQYRVMNTQSYSSLHKNVLDSMQLYNTQINTHNQVVDSLTSIIDKQTIDLKQNIEKAEKAQLEVDSMVFMGVYVTKILYNTIMWSIILSLTALLIIILFLYRRGNSNVKSVRNRLGEVQDEFEEHRRNALLREQKLARELMDEKLRNKKS